MPVNKRRTLKRRNSKKKSTKKLKRISRGGTKNPQDDDSTVILDPITGNTMFFPTKAQAIKYNRDRSKLKHSPKKSAARKINTFFRRKSSISSTSSDSDKTKENSLPKKSSQNTTPSPLTPLLGTMANAS
tara:strand:- start:3035 stop:3424 length:390 start_codon:yes stop_codon:yes gene_type:complete